MLRISEIQTDESFTLRLEGRLLGPWVDELQTVYLRAATHASVRLDLRNLMFVDADGAAALRGLIQRGATLAGCSNFVSEVLGTTTASEDRSHA